MIRKSPILLVALLLCLVDMGANVAVAGPLRIVEFSLVGSPEPGACCDGTGYGSFSFNDSVMPNMPDDFTGSIEDNVVGLPTVSLSLFFGPLQFDRTTARISELRFTNGELSFWQIGGLHGEGPCSLTPLTCNWLFGTQPDFFLFGYEYPQSVDQLVGSFVAPGDVRFSSNLDLRGSWSVRQVPEPSTSVLLSVGFLVIALVRRRRSNVVKTASTLSPA